MSMNCVYIYKNNLVFNSEEQLDDFILNKGIELYSKYGDIALQTAFSLEILELVKQEANKYQKLYKEAKESATYSIGLDEASLNFKPPYVGVSKFLAGLRNAAGRLLFPEFDDYEYWIRRIKVWNEEGFNEDEKRVLGDTVPTEEVTKEELKLFVEGDNYYSDNLTLDCIGKIREYWMNLGKIGTLIHGVLKYLFLKTKSGELKMTQDDAYLVDEITKYNSSINKKTAQDIINYARNLRQYIEEILGPRLLYFPEFQVVGKTEKEVEGKGDTILGIVDLLVIDETGKAHIIDYKASPKHIFDSAKELTFNYQLGLYHRLLSKHGLPFAEDNITLIAPILMEGLQKQGDSYTISGVRARNPLALLQDITVSATMHTVRENLDEFIPMNLLVTLPPEEVGDKLKKFNDTLFANLDTNKTKDDKFIKKWIDDKGGIVQDDSTLKYYIKDTGIQHSFVGKTELEVIEKVTKYFNETLPKLELDYIKLTKLALRKAVSEKTSDVDIPVAKKLTSEDSSADWLRRFISKYANGNYIIEDNPILEAYGIIMVVNTVTKQRDFIKITTDDLRKVHNFEGNKLITGSFISDRLLAKKSGDLTVLATNGNIYTMQVMALLNCMYNLTAFDNSQIGEIHVINPALFQGNPYMSKEELLYNFKLLINQVKGFDDNIDKLTFADTVVIMRNKLEDILNFSDNRVHKQFLLYKQTLTDLDAAITEMDELKALESLNALAKDLERKFFNQLELSLDSYDETQNPVRSLYEKTILAIAKLKGISFRQHIKPKSSGFEFANGGLQSIIMDNPGNLDNDTLNNLVTLVTQAYLNVREEVLLHMKKIRPLVENLKKAKGFSKFKEMTTGNMASLYTDLMYVENGDLLFKNPWDPTSDIDTEEEREFLKYVLLTINDNRFGQNSESKKNSVEYFRVPLSKGDSQSASATYGSLVKSLQHTLSRMNPKKWWDNTQNKILGIFNDDSESLDSRNLFKMTNLFNEPDLETRLAKIRQEGEAYFEKNLETLLIKHIFAYAQLKHINEIMPMAKASMIHLLVQGLVSNQQYKLETKYVKEYILNKIKNQNISDHPELWNAVGKLRNAASFLILAFNPVLYPGQLIQGLLQDIRILIQNAGDKDSPYNLKNFKRAWYELHKDMFKLGGKATKCSLLNEFFGMNDMDMNTYAEKIKSDKYGIFNFTNIAFHCASRPDFFNRMSLFIAQMMHDGTWEAYSLDSNGNLKYDFNQDVRFLNYINGNTNSEKYHEEKALYEAMARQLVNEGALNLNGTRFKFGDALPKAYTNQQIESFKSVSDTIYGYYTHEKKAMIHAYGWGALWMQMRTFWSGKKNQYLGAGGIKLQGKYVHQTDASGNKMYYKLEEGKLVPTTEVTDLPILKWEGLWLEGILCSMKYLLHDLRNHKVQLHELRNNPDYALQYANLVQLVYDTVMFLFVGSIVASLMGDWSELLQKEAKKSESVDDALLASVATIAMKSVNYGFLDFNFFESIGGPIFNILPVALNYYSSRISDLGECISGDKSFANTLSRISSAGSNMRPLLNIMFD